MCPAGTTVNSEQAVLRFQFFKVALNDRVPKLYRGETPASSASARCETVRCSRVGNAQVGMISIVSLESEISFLRFFGNLDSRNHNRRFWTHHIRGHR